MLLNSGFKHAADFPHFNSSDAAFRVEFCSALVQRYVHRTSKGFVLYAMLVVYSIGHYVAQQPSQGARAFGRRWKALKCGAVHYTLNVCCAVIPLSDVCLQTQPKFLFADFDKCLI